MAKIQSQTAIADPAHKGVDARAIVEMDEDRLADVRNQIAFDHRAARRDVDDRDDIFLAAEDDHGAIDEALFNEVTAEHVAVYAKIEPFVEELRELTKTPNLLANLEKLVSRIPAAEEKTAHFRERAKARQTARPAAAAA